MERAVSYLISGDGHLCYLIPSIHTLRSYYGGTIEVHAYPESYELVKEISQDYRLGIEPHLFKPITGRQVIDRFGVSTRPGAERRLYLDADTTFHGPIEELFEELDQKDVAFTQYGKFLVSYPAIKGRIGRFRRYKEIDQDLVTEVMESSDPAINGGVYCCRPESEVMETWYRWSRIAKRQLVPDETTANLILRKFSDRTTVLDGRWNMSAKFWRMEDIRIYHYSGQAALRPQIFPKATQRWWLLFTYCCGENFGKIREWIHKIDNPFLKECFEMRKSEAWDKCLKRLGGTKW